MANILLIDDEADVVAANQASLEARGHHAQIARTVGEAEKAMAESKPDAVVLETMVDGPAGGFGFAGRIAAKLPGVPLILLTRADDVLDPATRRRQDRDGWIPAARFFEKPVPAELVAEEVEHVLHEAHAAAHAGTARGAHSSRERGARS